MIVNLTPSTPGLRPIILDGGVRTLVTEVDFNRATLDEIAYGAAVWRNNLDGTHSHVPRERWPDGFDPDVVVVTL